MNNGGDKTMESRRGKATIVDEEELYEDEDEEMEKKDKETKPNYLTKKEVEDILKEIGLSKEEIREVIRTELHTLRKEWADLKKDETPPEPLPTQTEKTYRYWRCVECGTNYDDEGDVDAVCPECGCPYARELK